MSNLLLSCDWGTSSFRLKLVDNNHSETIGEVTSDKGIANTYNRWEEVLIPKNQSERLFLAAVKKRY